MDHRLDRRTVSFVIAAAAVLPGAMLFNTYRSVAEEASPAASPAAGATPGATPGAGGNDVTIGSYDIRFDPKDVTIPADTDVTIKLPNHGAAAHNFSITDHKNDQLPFDPISIDIAPGKTEQVTINAPAGEYYFFCDVPGHEAAGMWGTLKVE